MRPLPFGLNLNNKNAIQIIVMHKININSPLKQIIIKIKLINMCNSLTKKYVIVKYKNYTKKRCIFCISNNQIKL